ncbi:hypothetical protein [Actinomyces vulturis]|uniref:hypothetical protein n=1 Tax=Actinomyces vulturis TaxID=1857645 RepID=UPI001FE1DE6D|nr:hypothetical protein [Actinomyces vulturis]
MELLPRWLVQTHHRHDLTHNNTAPALMVLGTLSSLILPRRPSVPITTQVALGDSVSSNNWRRHYVPLAMGVIAAFIAIAFFGILHFTSTLITEVAQPEATEVPTTSAPDPVSWNLEGFDREHLIDDEIFYDVNSMTEEDIRTFITTVNDGCMEGIQATPCLAQARFDTPDVPPTQFCPGGYYGAQQEDVATIVSDISQSCGINPRVLLVLMQKEQGLLTASGAQLTPSSYHSAAGYACPDGTVCDEEHAGLFNQLYGAASQFQRYRLLPDAYRFVAGQSVMVPFSPDEECGGLELTLENQATAALYNYTPYTPNSAAFDRHSQTCATWGNLAFYGFWTTWFGPPFVEPVSNTQP